MNKKTARNIALKIAYGVLNSALASVDFISYCDDDKDAEKVVKAFDEITQAMFERASKQGD